MSGPRISVCIPAFNRAHFLPDAVESVLRQTFADFELVISDNASTDGTPELLKQYADPRIRVHVNARNLGLVGNFNRCVELARGEFFVILGSDDYWEPDFLAEVMKLLERHPDLPQVQAGGTFVDGQKQTIGVSILRLEPLTEGREFFRRLLLDDLGGFTLLCSTVYRTETVRAMGGFDTRLPNTQDIALSARVALEGGVGYLARPLVYFRKHAANYHMTWHPPDYVRERLRMTAFLFDGLPPRWNVELGPLRKKVERHMVRTMLDSLVSQRLAGVGRGELLGQLLLCLRHDFGLVRQRALLRAAGAIALPPRMLPRAIESFGAVHRQMRRDKAARTT
jgi:glycosyltransferase involved in cell wall biosynthesis